MDTESGSPCPPVEGDDVDNTLAAETDADYTVEEVAE